MGFTSWRVQVVGNGDQVVVSPLGGESGTAFAIREGGKTVGSGVVVGLTQEASMADVKGAIDEIDAKIGLNDATFSAWATGGLYSRPGSEGLTSRATDFLNTIKEVTLM